MIKPSVGSKTHIQKRRIRVRKKVLGTPERPRLSVYRSLNHIYAQLFDDDNGRAILTVSTKSKEIAGKVKEVAGKIGKAKVVGTELARIAKEKNIVNVVFDRGGYRYHGRVRAVADGAREGGLNF